MMYLFRLPRHLLTIICATLALSACSQPVSGPVRVEAITIVPETGLPVRSVVELSDVTDLWRAEGERIRFLEDMTIETLDASLAEDAHDNRDDLKDDLRAKAAGATPTMRMHEESGVWLADDYQTLLVFSAYAAVEKTLTAFRAFGDDSGATSAPLDVGIFSSVSRFLVPEASIENASYDDKLDAMFIGRAGLTTALSATDGSPGVALDAVVISHELGHRLFNYLVHDGQSYAFFLEESTRLKTERAGLLRAGVNEGCADAFAIAVHGIANIPSLSAERSLSGAFARDLTYEALRDDAFDDECGEASNNFTASGFNHYCVGTLFASTLWLGSFEDMPTYQQVMIPALVRALRRTGEHLADDFIDDGEIGFDLDDILEPLATEITELATRDAYCVAVRNRFGSLVAAGEIPTCALP